MIIAKKLEGGGNLPHFPAQNSNEIAYCISELRTCNVFIIINILYFNKQLKHNGIHFNYKANDRNYIVTKH